MTNRIMPCEAPISVPINDESTPTPTPAPRLRIPLPFAFNIRPSNRIVYEPPESEAGDEPPVWRRLRVNDQIIRASERGYLIINNGITYGNVLPGTPYRTVLVGDREYFVHDLVWRAFHGDPPTGYEVRHTRSAAVGNVAGCYDNGVRSLQIAMVTVTRDPKIAPTIFYREE